MCWAGGICGISLPSAQLFDQYILSVIYVGGVAVICSFSLQNILYMSISKLIYSFFN